MKPDSCITFSSISQDGNAKFIFLFFVNKQYTRIIILLYHYQNL